MEGQILVKINIQPMLFKSRCKYCASTPKYLYFYLERYADYNHFILPRNFVYDMSFKEIRLNDPSTPIKDRVFSLNYLFNAMAIAYNRGKIPGIKFQQDMEVHSILECRCGKAHWEFTRSHRDHIRYRKCEKLIMANDIIFDGFL